MIFSVTLEWVHLVIDKCLIHLNTLRGKLLLLDCYILHKGVQLLWIEWIMFAKAGSSFLSAD